MLGDENNIILAPVDPREVCFEGRLPQVELARLNDGIRMVADGPVQLPKLLQPVFEGFGLLKAVGSLYPPHRRRDGRDGGGLKGVILTDAMV